MDQIQIDADSRKNLMTRDNADSQDPDSDCDTPPAGSESSSSEDIQVDQDSDCDSESAPENLFGAFTDNEMMTRVEGMERKAIVKSFVNGMGKAGKETRIVAVHKNSSGLIQRARFEAFRIFTEAVARKCGGNPNIQYGCFGGSKEEIAEILAYGFSARNEAVRGRVHLVPVRFAVDAAAACGVDEDGMRHLLVCKVLLGKSKMMPEGFSRNGQPDSIEFDSGVDRKLNPRKYIVWSASMNTHICPAYVVSFKAPGGLEKYVAPPSKVFHLNDLLAVLGRFLAPEKLAVLYQWRDDYKAKKISLVDLRRKLGEVDKDVMDIAMKLVEPRMGELDDAFPAPGVVNLPCVMEVLPRFLPASKMDVLAKVRDDYEKKKISLAELNRRVGRVVDEKVLASAIKLMKPGLTRRGLFVDALARFLPPSQMKIIVEFMEDYKSKKISVSEFNRKFKLIVDDKVLASAIKLVKTNSQQRSNTASDVGLKVPKSQIYFPDLLPFLESSLSTQKMALLTKSYEDFRANKISRDQMIQRAALIVGKELLNTAIKSYRSQQQNV